MIKQVSFGHTTKHDKMSFSPKKNLTNID